MRHSMCFAAATASRPAAGKGDATKEAHKIFDEVVITVRSGRGGRGEITESGKGKKVPNFKYRAGSSLPKQIWLPAAEPADGADGASVLLVADPALDNLLHLHSRKTLTAKHGANGNPVEGTQGPRSRGKQQPRTPPLKVPVPMGTVVKRKRGGALLGELMNPGDTLLVARGGKGGLGVVWPAAQPSARPRGKFLDEDEGVVVDDNWAMDAAGGPGEEVGLQLLMRIVADVGIVGLPNAGKSSLLAALTRASPEVAPYPFTTLMPNLGVMAAGQPASAAGAEPDLEPWEVAAEEERAPVLADLPGLIEGAHAGRGLGRNFLRHLRRTRGILHVIDASAEDPAADYEVVRQELAMYNPQYCARPHLVALNKMDLADAAELHREIAQDILSVARRMQAEFAVGEDVKPSLPLSLVRVSAVSGSGVEDLREALRDLLD
ncbi:g5469 [Coccomyxa elongata]